MVSFYQFLSLSCFKEIPVVNAASNLGLHCLPISLLWDSGGKWVKSVVGVKMKLLGISLSIRMK